MRALQRLECIPRYLAVAGRRLASGKPKLAVPAAIADERAEAAEAAGEKEAFCSSGSIRYRVCQERVPVHKVIDVKHPNYDEQKVAMDLRDLQPAMLPEYYAKNHNG